MIEVREYLPDEAGVLAAIYHRAVREGAGTHYSDAERAAWSPEQPSAQDWAAKLDGTTTFVAETEGRPVGFMSLCDDGYLALAFVLPEVMGTGVADALYAAVLNRALARGLDGLTAHASHMARSFFLRHGWQHIETETSIRNNVRLTRHRMDLPFGTSGPEILDISPALPHVSGVRRGAGLAGTSP